MDKKIAGLAILAVILIALNIFQFYYFNYMTNNVPAEDVPMQIMDLKGDKWRDYIGKRVTVEGYFFSVGGDYPMLVSNFTFLYLRDEMPNEDYIRLDGTIPQALQGGARYQVKGTAKQSGDETEKLFLQYEAYKLIDTGILPPKLEAAYHVTLTAQPQPMPNHYAVLISGGIDEGGARLAFWNDLKFTYSVLVNKYHYNQSNIFVVYKDGVAEDTEMPVHYSATAANVDTVLNTVKARMTSNDYLFIFVSNHGGLSGTSAFISLYYRQQYSDSTLATKLATMSYARIILVMDICHSGGFIDNISGTNRIVVTASTAAQSSFDADTEGAFGEFTWHFMSACNFQTPSGVAVDADVDDNGWVSVGEAFNYAATHISTSNTPQYDDNGDDVGHAAPIPNGGDGGLANTYF